MFKTAISYLSDFIETKNTESDGCVQPSETKSLVDNENCRIGECYKTFEKEGERNPAQEKDKNTGLEKYFVSDQNGSKLYVKGTKIGNFKAPKNSYLVSSVLLNRIMEREGFRSNYEAMKTLVSEGDLAVIVYISESLLSGETFWLGSTKYDQKVLSLYSGKRRHAFLARVMSDMNCDKLLEAMSKGVVGPPYFGETNFVDESSIYKNRGVLEKEFTEGEERFLDQLVERSMNKEMNHVRSDKLGKKSIATSLVYWVCMMWLVVVVAGEECLLQVSDPIFRLPTVKDCPFGNVTFVHNHTVICRPDNTCEKVTHENDVYAEGVGNYIDFDCTSSIMTTRQCYDLCVAHNYNTTYKTINLVSLKCRSSDGKWGIFSVSNKTIDQARWNDTAVAEEAYPTDCVCASKRLVKTVEKHSDNLFNMQASGWALFGNNVSMPHIVLRSEPEENVKYVVMTMTADKTIVISNKNTTTLFCSGQKEDVTVHFSVSSYGTYVFPISSEMYINSGSLNFVCSSNGIVVKRESFYIVSMSYCDLHNCVFCWTAIDDFSCIPVMGKILIIGGFVLGVWVIALLFPWMAFGLSLSWKIGYYIMKTMLWRVPKYIMEKMNKKVKLDDMVSNLKEDIERETKPTKKRSNVPMDRTMAKVIVIICLLPIAFCCDVSVMGSASISDCISQGELEVCSMTFVETLPYKRVGEIACLSIRDENNFTLAQVNVTWQANEVVFPLTYVYSTSAYKEGIAGTFRCYGAGSCNGENCANVGPQDISAYGEISDFVQRPWPGKTECSGGCSGGMFECGCWHGDAGCVFTRYGLKPYGSVAKVYTISSNPIKNQFLRIKIHHENQTVGMVTDQKLSRYTSALIDGLDFDWLGDLGTTNHPFEGKGIVSKDGYGYTAEISQKGAPKKGLIGDIQATSDGSFSGTGSTGAFIFDETNFHPTIYSKSAALTSTYKSAMSVFSGRRLPLKSDNSLWSLYNSQLMSNVSNPPTMVLSIKSNKKIMIIRKNTKVCPVGSVVEMTGCKNCLKGGILKLSLMSKCGEGFVNIESDVEGLNLVGTARLSVTSSEFEFRFHTGLSSAEGNIIVKGTGGTLLLKFDSKFAEITNLPKATYDKTSAVVRDGDGSGTFDPSKVHASNKVSGVVSSSYSWVTSLIVFVVVLAVIGGFAFVFVKLSLHKKLYASMKLVSGVKMN